MRTLDEIQNTPVLLLTAEEIDQLDPKSQVWARSCQARHAREQACPKHEPTGTSTRNGWHSLKCKHCGIDMSCDSGD
jgi:hypothetical protein